MRAMGDAKLGLSAGRERRRRGMQEGRGDKREVSGAIGGEGPYMSIDVPSQILNLCVTARENLQHEKGLGEDEHVAASDVSLMDEV